MNVPADGNVWENRPPPPRIPLSKPVPVTVWSRSDWFVHETVPPGATVTVLGEKDRSRMATEAVAGAAGAGEPAGGCPGAGEFGEPPPG